jgi:hypothetical protein
MKIIPLSILVLLSLAHHIYAQECDRSCLINHAKQAFEVLETKEIKKEEERRKKALGHLDLIKKEISQSIKKGSFQTNVDIFLFVSGIVKDNPPFLKSLLFVLKEEKLPDDLKELVDLPIAKKLGYARKANRESLISKVEIVRDEKFKDLKCFYKVNDVLISDEPYFEIPSGVPFFLGYYCEDAFFTIKRIETLPTQAELILFINDLEKTEFFDEKEFKKYLGILAASHYSEEKSQKHHEEKEKEEEQPSSEDEGQKEQPFSQKESEDLEKAPFQAWSLGLGASIRNENPYKEESLKWKKKTYPFLFLDYQYSLFYMSLQIVIFKRTFFETYQFYLNPSIGLASPRYFLSQFYAQGGLSVGQGFTVGRLRPLSLDDLTVNLFVGLGFQIFDSLSISGKVIAGKDLKSPVSGPEVSLIFSVDWNI